MADVLIAYEQPTRYVWNAGATPNGTPPTFDVSGASGRKIVVLAVEADYNFSGPTYAVVDDKGNTWNRIIRFGPPGGISSAELWAAEVNTDQTAVQVTVTVTGAWNFSNTAMATVWVLDNVDALANQPAGVLGNRAEVGHTPTALGSLLFGSFATGNEAGTLTPRSNTTITHQYDGGASGVFINAAMRSTAPAAALTQDTYGSPDIAGDGSGSSWWEVIPDPGGAPASNAGFGSGLLVVTGSGTGSAPVVPPASGSGGGTVAVSGSGSGSAPTIALNAGSGSGTLAITGSGSGSAPVVPDHAGSGSGVLSITGSGSGTSPRTGSGSGTLHVTGTGSASTAHRGTGTGLLRVTGSGVGRSPTVGVSGGSGSGLLRLTGNGTGHAPLIPRHAGSGSGLLRLTALGTGHTTRHGSGSGLLRLTAEGTGRNPAAEVRDLKIVATTPPILAAVTTDPTIATRPTTEPALVLVANAPATALATIEPAIEVWPTTEPLLDIETTEPTVVWVTDEPNL